MASPSDRPLATGLANRLVAPIFVALDRPTSFEIKSPAAREFQAAEYDIYLPDVQLASEQFGAQAVWFERAGLQMPCLHVSGEPDTPMPIAVAPLGSPPDVWRPGPESLGNMLSLLTRRDIGAQFVSSAPHDAVRAFQKRLTDFLEARFSARQSNISAAPGLTFTVTTSSSGLRVYYSPIYWLSRQHVLNFPTAPPKGVTGYVQPGRFYFGAGLPGVTPNFDFTARYSVPPDSNAHLAM